MTFGRPVSNDVSFVQECHISRVSPLVLPLNQNRGALWLSDYDQSHELYYKVRKCAMREDSAFLMAHAEVVQKSAQTIAVQKGWALVVFSSIGSQSAKNTRSVQSRFRAGSEVTNVLTYKTQAVKHYSRIRAGDLY